LAGDLRLGILPSDSGFQAMSERALSRAQLREIDRRAIEELGLPGAVLMENAGRGATEILLQQQPVGIVAICCGKGNNGGDGFVIARHLLCSGQPLELHLVVDPSELRVDAALHFRVLMNLGVVPSVWQLPDQVALFAAALQRAGWIVDALLGTGATGIPRDPYLTAIRLLNESGKPILAVDLPSGMDADLGVNTVHHPHCCVRATRTATFVADKLAFLKPGSREWTGPIEVVGIGVPASILDDPAPDQSSVMPGNVR